MPCRFPVREKPAQRQISRSRRTMPRAFRTRSCPSIERAVGVQWYDTVGNDADIAALALCRLRRSRAGLRGGPEHGDAAVREALQEVDPGAVAWIASRAISYMDENGYPEAMAPFFDDEP